MCDTYVRGGFTGKVRTVFRRKCQCVTVSGTVRTIHRMVNKLRWAGSLLDSKPE
jgi:hypothetical protein